MKKEKKCGSDFHHHFYHSVGEDREKIRVLIETYIERVLEVRREIEVREVAEIRGEDARMIVEVEDEKERKELSEDGERDLEEMEDRSGRGPDVGREKSKVEDHGESKDGERKREACCREWKKDVGRRERMGMG